MFYATCKKLLWFFGVLALLMTISVKAASAYTQPQAGGTSYYVPNAWNTTSYPGVAYTRGEYANAGISASGDPTNGSGCIILDFGRQAQNPNGNWGVYLPGTSTFWTDAQVEACADAFMEGWNDYNTQFAFVFISTNNCDYPWLQGDPRWAQAGTDWANLINNIDNDTGSDYNAIAMAGNDIETWQDTFLYNNQPWLTYGPDTVNWFNNYWENLNDLVFFTDFGSNCYAENNSAWTQDELATVSFDYWSVPIPEIYYQSNATEWSATFAYAEATYPYSYTDTFFGTLVENVSGELTWSEAWNALNNDISQQGYPNGVWSYSDTIIWGS